MCGRFFVVGESENELLARMINEAERRKKALTGEGGVSVGEVFPGTTVAALALSKEGRAGAYPMLWGFGRPGGKGLVINARSETALDKAMFHAPMLERRCLIPCNWYFEWETADAQVSMADEAPSFQALAESLKPGKRKKDALKIKYAIRPKAPGIMYLAGIYRYEADKKLPCLSILTREAAPGIAFIHDRMPVIFSQANHAAWLDRAADPRETLRLCETEMDFRAAS